MNLIKDFVGLLFPEVCFVCGNSLFKNEKIVCTRCFLHLPETNFHHDPDNPVAKVFWGRVPLQAATALYFYRKGGAVQNLIHQLKYNGRKEIGIHLGNILGAAIGQVSAFQSVDVVLPLPLHHKKLKKRGFNQSEVIARGIAEVTGMTVDSSVVIRNRPTETQTKKSRYRRWENVSEMFQVVDEQKLHGKHVLVVDDVITTGATMEACLQSLAKVPGIKLSAAAVAFAFK